MSSGRSSGGGGSSGAVDYPEYQKVIQADWLGGGSYESPNSMARLDPGNSITDLINRMIGASPYEGATAYDPADKLNDMNNAVINYLPRLDKEVDAFLTYAEDYIDQLKNDTSLANAETILNDTDLTKFVSDYERDGSISRLSFIAEDFDDQVSPELYYTDGSLDQAMAYVWGMDTTEDVERELSQFNSNMREINAVHSSAFAIGTQIVASGLQSTKAQLQSQLAKYKSDKMLQYVQLKADVQQRLAELHTKVASLKNEKARVVLASQLDAFQRKIEPVMQLGQLKQDKQKAATTLGTQAHSTVYNSVADAVHQQTRLSIEAKRMAIVAFKEEAAENLRIDSKDALWDVEVFQGAANVMASVAGGTVTTPEEPKDTGSALGGALSGAASGAMVGSQINPGWGTAIGAVVGGIGGALMS